MSSAVARRYAEFERTRPTIPDQMLRDTAVVILTWNQRDKTRRCLESLEAAGYSLTRVLVWDNGSVDETEAMLKHYFGEAVYLRSTTNLGVASGRNAAAAHAMRLLNPRYLLFLDNDMVVTPGFLEALSQPFVDDPNLAQAVAKVRILDRPEALHVAGGIHIDFKRGIRKAIGLGEVDNGQYDAMTDCLPCGGATLVRVDVFQLLEGFDIEFDPYGAEDIDFSLSVRRAGFRAVFVPEAIVFHDWHKQFVTAYLNRSEAASLVHRWLILVRKHASPSEKLAFCIRAAPLMLLRILVRELRRGNYAAIKGLPDGVRNVFRRDASGRDVVPVAFHAPVESE